MTATVKKLLSVSLAGALALALAACTPSLPSGSGGPIDPTDPQGPGVSGPSTPEPGGNGQGGPGSPQQDHGTAQGQVATTLEQYLYSMYNEIPDDAFDDMDEFDDPETHQELIAQLAVVETMFPEKIRVLVASESATPEDRYSFWFVQLMSVGFFQLAKVMAQVEIAEFNVDQSKVQVHGNTAVVPADAVETNLGPDSITDDYHLVYTEGRWKISISGS